MKKGLVVTTLAVAIALVTYQNRAQAASASANALASVIAALSISQVSDLNFGDGAQGDSAKSVAPGSAENSENASFSLTGEASRTFTISLPADNTVTMTTGDGVGATKQIGVNSFASTPSGTGTLDNAGSATLYVGATRGAIAANQEPGSYSASFSVTVVYQ